MPHWIGYFIPAMLIPIHPKNNSALQDDSHGRLQGTLFICRSVPLVP